MVFKYAQGGGFTVRSDIGDIIETHKNRQTLTCRCCGRTELQDHVRLKRIKVLSGLDRYECVAPCERNKKKKKVKVKRGNSRVMIGDVWCNSLLERLSGQLSTRTVSFEPKGEQSKLACPEHYAYDLMIPLAHAERTLPLGWIIFGAKYMHDANAMKQLLDNVAAAFGGQENADKYARIVVDHFCYGLLVSARSLRRTLNLTRGAESAFQSAMQGILSNLHAVEESYAREVKKYL